MAAESLVQSALTWALANASSLGLVFGWITKPIRDRLTALENRATALDEKLSEKDEALELRIRSLESQATRGGDVCDTLRRDSDAAARELREIRQLLGELVSDEEFRGFIEIANQKTEKIVETLGYIKGRIGREARP